MIFVWWGLLIVDLTIVSVLFITAFRSFKEIVTTGCVGPTVTSFSASSLFLLGKNILLDSDRSVKLADFGVSRTIQV